MFVCCGFTAYSNSMYHLVNHAFFKALLFPTAGYIIHALGNEQDIRRMGGLLRASPPPYTSMLIGSLSLVGFPFPSGFYPKDKIIELCFNNYIGVADVVSTYRYIIFAQILCILAVIFTSIYSIKLLFYVFPNSYCGFKSYVTQLHFSTIYIQMPPVFLSITSITSGYLTTDMMVGLGTTFRMKSLYIDTFITADSINIFKVQFPLHTEYNSYIRNITVVRTIYFIFGSIAPLLYIKHFSLHALLGSVTWVRHLYTIIAKKYVFINRLVLHPAVNRIMIFAYEVTYKCLDKGIVEFVGPFGITHSIAHLAKPQYLLQSGLIYHYPGFMFIFIMIIIHITPDVQFI
jgi:NADH-ubiquinone oxidoreductase chain 5